MWGRVLAGIFVVAADSAAATTSRVSVATGGAQAAGGSSANAVLSVDGRFVAFDSAASNLVTGDVNAQRDVFLHDRQSGVTTRVSVATGGNEASGGSSQAPSISANGRYIAFDSAATSLVTGDTNNARDVFVRDVQLGTTTRVSVATGGGEVGGASYGARISDDGRYVAFGSVATTLVAGDTNAAEDVFVHDRQLGTTIRVSVSTAGVQGVADSYINDLSADGRFITFEVALDNNNLTPGDFNNLEDVLLHDQLLHTTTRVSVPTGGVPQVTDFACIGSRISPNGRFVGFSSQSAQLVPGDTNGNADLFLHDLAATRVTCRFSLQSSGAQISNTSNSIGFGGMSDDTRLMVFHTRSTDVVPGDTNGFGDIFLHVRGTGTTSRVSVGPGGIQAVGGHSLQPHISGNGLVIAYSSSATNLVASDTNVLQDVFVYDMTPPQACAGDTNADNAVNGADLSVLLARFGTVCN